MNGLRDLVDAWQVASADFVALARRLRDDEWPLPTDCPGWSVHDVVAHAAALESELAGDSLVPVVVDEQAAHIRSAAGLHTERGVQARRARGHHELVEELEDALRRRAALLADEPLDDPTGDPPVTPGGVGWSWSVLLSNRVLDFWVHEQDIRRATGRPGGLDSVAARHTQSVFGAALPYVVGKRTDGPPGSTVVVDITGPVPATYGVEVRNDNRGHRVDAQRLGNPTARITLDTESFTVLAAGRRDPGTLPVRVEGDADLAQQVLAGLAVTP